MIALPEVLIDLLRLNSAHDLDLIFDGFDMFLIIRDVI